jgi:hypothetical protein
MNRPHGIGPSGVQIAGIVFILVSSVIAIPASGGPQLWGGIAGAWVGAAMLVGGAKTYR